MTTIEQFHNVLLLGRHIKGLHCERWLSMATYHYWQNVSSS